MVPPGRHTLTSSSAVAWWSGANIAPIADITTSYDASANGSAIASAVRHSMSSPRSRARRFPISSSSGVRSVAVTLAPMAAAGMLAAPVPAATSSTRSPAPSPLHSTSLAPWARIRSLMRV